MVLDILEPGQVQLADPGARDAKYLAKHSVANILLVAWPGYQLAKLQLDDVVDLLLGKLLHNLFMCYEQANSGDICGISCIMKVSGSSKVLERLTRSEVAGRTPDGGKNS